MVTSFVMAGSALAQSSSAKFPTSNAKLSSCLDRVLPGFAPWRGSILIKEGCTAKNPVDCVYGIRAHGRSFGGVSHEADLKMESDIAFSTVGDGTAPRAPIQAEAVHRILERSTATETEQAIFTRAQASFGQAGYVDRLKEAYDAAYPEPTETFQSHRIRVTRSRPDSYWVMEGDRRVWRRSQENAIHPGTLFELDPSGLPSAVYRISGEHKRFPLTIYHPRLWTIFINLEGDAPSSKLFVGQTKAMYHLCVRPLMRKLGIRNGADNLRDLVLNAR